MKALVVGFGSIGARHARLLGELGCLTSVVSSRAVDHARAHRTLEDALSEAHPDYVVIANSTDRHYDALSRLARLGYSGVVLVEKPLFDGPRELPANTFRAAFVGYNLRFHPVVQRLAGLVKDAPAISVQAYAGQYLPAWRPSADYRASYSASAARGGGVLRDLSHELDYLTWLFGAWIRVTARGGHLSPLEIDSDDVYALMFETRACPIVQLQINYLDRTTKRFAIVNTAGHTIEADIVGGAVIVDGRREALGADRDHTYCAMHRAALEGDSAALCDIGHAAGTLGLIAAAERASERREWVEA
ncbi:MAG: Oxidoreductase [Betaproteobacteria bacterium]|nr:Oxidoreductase [Betaproteobacteria bacterium]